MDKPYIRTMKKDLEILTQGLSEKQKEELLHKYKFAPILKPDERKTAKTFPKIIRPAKPPTPIKKTQEKKEERTIEIPKVKSETLTKQIIKVPPKKINWPRLAIYAGSAFIIAVGLYFTWQALFIVEEPIPIVKPPIKTTPELPKPFIEVEDSKIITLSDKNKETLLRELNLAYKEFEIEAQREIFKQIIIELPNDAGFSNASDFFEIMEIAIPESLKENIEETFTLLFYKQEEGARIAIIIKLKDINSAIKELSLWESTMENDLEPLFLAEKGEASSKSFKDNTYKDVKIRYLNFPNPDLTLDYAVYQSKNYLLITASKDSMYSLIDKI